MGRKTQQNDITSDELLNQVNPDNLRLKEDFITYLDSLQRSLKTLNSYSNDIDIFFVWNLQNNKNKFYIDLTKRDIISFQNYLANINKNSPARIRRLKATLSSMSNYVENILDDEYPNYRNIIRKVENPVNRAVRDKTVFKDEQLEELLNKLVEKKKYKEACALSLAMCSGRRKSELTRFKVSYFDDENIIYGSLYKTPEEIETKGRGRGGKPLQVYTLVKEFKPYFDLWMNERKEKGIESQWLFPKKVGSSYIDEQVDPGTLDTWADIFTRLLDGIPFYWHSLRHYFTTHLSESGIPNNVIQDIVGWDSADMCNIYIDTSTDSKLSEYFGDEGIKEVKPKTLADL